VDVFQCGLNDVLWKEVFNQILKSKHKTSLTKKNNLIYVNNKNAVLKILMKINLKFRNNFFMEISMKSSTGILLKKH
jgi:hypothetical protein